MKKLVSILLVLSILLIFPITACDKEDGSIELNEVTHSVFYAPLYVAIEGGYMKDNGIDINLTNGGGADSVMAAVLSGSADIGFAGPESVIYVYNQGKNDYPMVFAQLTQRDGSFLVSRKNEPNFKWSDLAGKEIIAGRRGGVPAMTFEYVCNQNGLYNGTNVTLNLDIAFNLTTSAFEGGTGDYCTMFEPTASEYQNSGKGYIVASVGEAAGDVPYTAFFASKSFIKNNQNKLKGFIKGLKQAYEYMNSHTNSEIAEVIKGQFPSTDVTSLAKSISQYKSIGAWNYNLQPTEASYTRLQDILENSKELTKRVEFSQIVDCKLAQEIFS